MREVADGRLNDGTKGSKRLSEDEDKLFLVGSEGEGSIHVYAYLLEECPVEVDPVGKIRQIICGAHLEVNNVVIFERN